MKTIRGWRRGVAALCACAGLAAFAGPALAAAGGGTLATARALAVAMRGGRSGEAAVSYALADPIGGGTRTIRGRVRVEAPDRVRLDFTTTGERITLRGDGGEWLQPATRQLIRIPADRAAAALAWWRVLLPANAAEFREESLGARRYRITPAGDDPQEVKVTARLDAKGYPSELVVEGLFADPVTYRLSGWTFGRGRGAAAYRTTAPAGYETIELP